MCITLPRLFRGLSATGAPAAGANTPLPSQEEKARIYNEIKKLDADFFSTVAYNNMYSVL